MAEKSEKPTRKRTSSPKKATKAERPVDREEVAKRAYFIYLEEGRADELDNWLRAEREVATA
jgi:DUF2934 family protein